ncbi:peptidoglycan DD-metalloendopeptidase family protein [Patescibacteria group bacterium]|nr:peptidoglycan DD-metalloendopeptidase family protein [Patescibacteria group bacterium]MBU1062709.1 peptidoglycan DD-metalloendopeptidase family protein [Patescibacteria group bacterium]
MPSFSYGKIEANQNEEIKEINRQIDSQQDKIKKMQDQQEVYKGLIKQKQGEKANLNNQLAILDNRLAKAELDIESVATEIERTNLEIKKINLEITDKDQQISKQKDHLITILQLMQKQDQNSSLEILLSNNSFTEFMDQVKYLEDINSEVGETLDSLKESLKELDNQQQSLTKKDKELAKLKEQLGDKQVVLNDEQDNKLFILDQTKSSEKEYQKLLKQAKAEQEQAAAEIVSLEKEARAKLSKIQNKKLEFNDSGFIWPVSKNSITATFHDPSYPFRYLFEHPGVDIRASQGSPVRASASGYVAKAKDAGLGYSYIMIIHGNGLATVYGHVSKIYVKEDEYVVQGQAIGASGGLPGTPGAGRMTTGPHMHFEVRLNGIPVDPMNYLP